MSLLLVFSCVVAGAVVGWRVAAVADPNRPAARNRGRLALEPTVFLQREGPSLNGGLAWINSAPIRLEELRGKIVLLDFWTYCCINCHHILPELAKLEEKYWNELVVIGVHTPKFFAERDTENLRQKVREYRITHPVVNDADQVIWNRFGVDTWPTLVVLGPNGEVLGRNRGEVTIETLDAYIGRVIREHRAALDETPIRFFPEAEQPDRGPLSFPGKVLADAEGRRLFIADTGHNRIVRATLEGGDPIPIGNGSAGLVDGSFEKAEFNRPQGMCLVGETLYVADTENHALRAIDLKAGTVSTVAGNGKQTHNLSAHGAGKTTSLSSPWDVLYVPKMQSLLIAMAGLHQIWRYDLNAGTVGVWAGTGREEITDGPPFETAFAQPSGLATDGQSVFVADSETSSIRAIALDRRHSVQTIVGSGLFVFDDVDGQGEQVRLQHVLGLAYGRGNLYIADTYNNKIKVCDPKTRTVETLVGTRQPGDSDFPPRFYQPGGLGLAGSHLYVADTNNGKIKVIDLNDKRVRTLALDALQPPAAPARKPTFPNAEVTDVPQVQVAPGKAVTLDVSLPLPAGYKLNADVPMPYLVEAPGRMDALAPDAFSATQKVDPPSPQFSITVPLAQPAAAGDSLRLKVSVSAFICSEGSGLCKIQSYTWNVPITFARDGLARVALSPASRTQ